MDLLLAIVLIVLAFLGGALGGMYLVRKQIEKEFADNPRLNAEAVRTLLSANGQKPSEAKDNKFTTKSSANKRQPLLTIKRKNK
ncbi:family protein [Streptococcus pneumoniae]|nr:family protein [Streptococcus pneumoniae]